MQNNNRITDKLWYSRLIIHSNPFIWSSYCLTSNITAFNDIRIILVTQNKIDLWNKSLCGISQTETEALCFPSGHKDFHHRLEHPLKYRSGFCRTRADDWSEHCENKEMKNRARVLIFSQEFCKQLLVGGRSALLMRVSEGPWHHFGDLYFHGITYSVDCGKTLSTPIFLPCCSWSCAFVSISAVCLTPSLLTSALFSSVKRMTAS